MLFCSTWLASMKGISRINMHWFYTNNITNGLAQLDEIEARHCLQVLRKKKGDDIVFVDGLGGYYEGRIEETGKKSCSIRIINEIQHFQQPKVNIHIAIAPTKNIARFEWFLEKATEIGIGKITPIRCQRSERKQIRNDRLEKVLASAMKQSLKAYLPQLEPLIDFRSFIEHPTLGAKNRFIAHCSPGVKGHLKDNCLPGSDVIILIGPEGDFSEEEVNLSKAKGFQEISLGQSRLRTETAGMVACHIVNLLNE